MQPGVSPVQSGSEQLPQPGAQNGNSGEHLPTLPAPEMTPVPSPEAGIETGAERREQAAELQAASADAASVATTLVPVDPATLVPVAPTPVVDTANPLTAADDDVIEKEWVDKAKHIIAATKDDPYKRGKEVGALQRDYLKKRYGKDIGAAA